MYWEWMEDDIGQKLKKKKKKKNRVLRCIYNNDLTIAVRMLHNRAITNFQFMILAVMSTTKEAARKDWKI